MGGKQNYLPIKPQNPWYIIEASIRLDSRFKSCP